MSTIKRLVPRLTSMAFKMKFDDLVTEIKPVCRSFPISFISFSNRLVHSDSAAGRSYVSFLSYLCDVFEIQALSIIFRETGDQEHQRA